MLTFALVSVAVTLLNSNRHLVLFFCFWQHKTELKKTLKRKRIIKKSKEKSLCLQSYIYDKRIKNQYKYIQLNKLHQQLIDEMYKL
jgi:hypothetical protein